MRRKTACLVAAIISLLCLAAAPASADSAPPGCFGGAYSVLFGQGIAVNCADPGKGYGYHVVAHCTTGAAFWLVAGPIMPYGFGPSSAECTGGLLDPAWVGGYHVVAD